MKKTVAVVLALTFIFAFVSLSFAAEQKATAPAEKKEAAPSGKTESAPTKKAVSKQVTGDVSAVDANANTIIVKGKKGDITIHVGNRTKIMSGKDKKTFADIKAGEKVTVKYIEADGKNTAKHVEIKVAGAEQKAVAPAEKK